MSRETAGQNTAGDPNTVEDPALDPELTSALQDFVNLAEPGSPILIASDFDGVLAPLVDDPALSRPLPRASAALQRLITADSLSSLALVSGRDLVALAGLASPPAGTLLIGSHGAEQGSVAHAVAPGRAPDLTHVPLELTEHQHEQLSALTQGLEQIAGAVEGAWVEHKPAAAVLHTRLSQPEAAAEATDRALELGQGVGVQGLAGKNVAEFAVFETTKGIALTALARELGASRVLYMGDDVTDEHAFERLAPQDVTIRIGPGPTLARFRVADPETAAVVLEELADLLEARSRADTRR